MWSIRISTVIFRLDIELNILQFLLSCLNRKHRMTLRPDMVYLRHLSDNKGSIKNCVTALLSNLNGKEDECGLVGMIVHTKYIRQRGAQEELMRDRWWDTTLVQKKVEFQYPGQPYVFGAEPYFFSNLFILKQFMTFLEFLLLPVNYFLLKKMDLSTLFILGNVTGTQFFRPNCMLTQASLC